MIFTGYRLFLPQEEKNYEMEKSMRCGIVSGNGRIACSLRRFFRFRGKFPEMQDLRVLIF
jgi:hypothetical protein